MNDKSGIVDLAIKAIENKAVAVGVGTSTSASAILNISAIATIAGLCLTFVCIYAQIRIIREAEKNAVREALRAEREAFEFQQRNPNAPEDLL